MQKGNGFLRDSISHYHSYKADKKTDLSTLAKCLQDFFEKCLLFWQGIFLFGASEEARNLET